jgi:hypothetical protein
MVGMNKPNLPMQKTAKDHRPFSYLWSFNPETREVVLEDEEGDGKADYPVHEEMAPHIVHPDRVDGYAIAIDDGWRIFTDDMDEPDPYITNQVRKALRDKHVPPLPQVLPHGSPLRF